MQPRPDAPSVFAWLFYQLFCAAAPALLVLMVRFAAPNPAPYEKLVGYSVILLIGLGVYLSTLSDVLVAQSLGMHIRGIATLAIGFVLTAVSAVGAIADELADRYQFLSFGYWLAIQAALTIGAMVFCAMTKSSLDEDERFRRSQLESELTDYRKQNPPSTP